MYLMTASHVPGHKARGRKVRSDLCKYYHDTITITFSEWGSLSNIVSRCCKCKVRNLLTKQKPYVDLPNWWQRYPHGPWHRRTFLSLKTDRETRALLHIICSPTPQTDDGVPTGVNGPGYGGPRAAFSSPPT